jgi:hypothetical protein
MFELSRVIDISPVDDEFAAWVRGLELHDDQDPGELAPGMMDFLNRIFVTRGPLPREDVDAAAREVEMNLGRRAIALVAEDVRRTTALTPQIEPRRLDDGTLVLSYDGNHSGTALWSMSAPHAICEVADNLRDHVVDDVWTGWPVCPDHGTALDPRPIDGHAVWYCRHGNHTSAAIGQLQSREPTPN